MATVARDISGSDLVLSICIYIVYWFYLGDNAAARHASIRALARHPRHQAHVSARKPPRRRCSIARAEGFRHPRARGCRRGGSQLQAVTVTSYTSAVLRHVNVWLLTSRTPLPPHTLLSPLPPLALLTPPTPILPMTKILRAGDTPRAARASSGHSGLD